MESFKQALRKKKAVKFDTIQDGVHTIKCIKPVEGKYGTSYIMLIGDDLQPYWSNSYMTTCIDGIEKDTFEDPTTKLLVNNGHPIATVEVMPCESGKYPKLYEFNELPPL